MDNKNDCVGIVRVLSAFRDRCRMGRHAHEDVQTDCAWPRATSLAHQTRRFNTRSSFERPWADLFDAALSIDRVTAGSIQASYGTMAQEPPAQTPSELVAHPQCHIHTDCTNQELAHKINKPT
jgi:hypothetical protein